MTIILTGKQSICYHVLLRIIAICHLFNIKSLALSWRSSTMIYFLIKNFILFIPFLLYSFCKLYDETPFHIFYEYNRVTCLSSELVQWLQNILILHILTPLNHFYHLRLPFLRSLMLQTMTPFFKKIVPEKKGS